MRVRIEKMVYGGAGLARTERGVVFVPRTAPGDVAEIEFVQRKADYAVGRAVEIIEPSPDRQMPTCPNYATAGCCHWQHIRYSRQLEIKEEILRETLKRIAHVDWDKPIGVITGPDRNYRMRATFHVKDRQVGFVVEGAHQITPIRACDSLVPELNEFIAEANTLLARPELASVREISAIAAPPVAVNFVNDRGQVHRRQFGPGSPRVAVDGFVFEVHPGAFFQSNRHLLGKFMTDVLEQAGEAPSYVLDLFCGSGFFSIPLGRRAKEVLGVELNPIAIRQGRLNARLNEVANVKFFRDRVEKILPEAAVRPDLILLNPPRSGCGRETARHIASLHAARIVYVSCNPSTFAREAAEFLQKGYALLTNTLY